MIKAGNAAFEDGHLMFETVHLSNFSVAVGFWFFFFFFFQMSFFKDILSVEGSFPANVRQIMEEFKYSIVSNSAFNLRIKGNHSLGKRLCIHCKPFAVR
jgi:hypothetical protein